MRLNLNWIQRLVLVGAGAWLFFTTQKNYGGINGDDSLATVQLLISIALFFLAASPAMRDKNGEQ